MKKVLLTFFAFSLFFTTELKAQYKYLFQDPKADIDARVENLVSLMTIEEKASQMMNTSPAIERLGVPYYNWWNECLHGIARSPYKVTVFPQAIGMAATWDTDAIGKMATYTSDEGRAIYFDALDKGIKDRYVGLTYWTPNINIFRDPRWGRGQETYGEDPFLTAEIGKVFVKGIEGNDEKYLKASACAKHYAVHSGPEPLRHVFNAEVSKYDLWDTYLYAFRDLIVDANVSGVMCAYNAYFGKPCCGSDILMQDILRNKWGFDGYVTSDCGAIDDFFKYHKTHPDAKSAAADAVYNGTDVDCGGVYASLVDAVKNGLISEEQVDVSLKRLFKIRFRLGMFDPKEMVPYSSIPISILECDKHKAHALDMARKSMVLLENKNGFLPLKKNLKKVLVVGPNANNKNALLGNYNGFPTTMNTPLDAIRQKLGSDVEIVYDQATDYVKGTPDYDAVLAKAKGADVAIFFGGINSSIEGEEGDAGNEALEGFHKGDRTSINLPKVQTAMMKKLHEAGIPTVFVLMTGSAMAMEWESENLPAIINAWYGGQSGGDAVADVIFGDYNPAGRLPLTFYRSDADLPPFESYDMDGRTYRYFKGDPRYTFGYGLSYTTFEYSDPKVTAVSETGKPLKVSFTIKNTGNMDGDEVAQLYVKYSTDKKAPIYALKAFKRVNIKAGKSAKVEFEITPRQLALVDDKGVCKVSPGDITLFVGGTLPTDKLISDKKIKTKKVSLAGNDVVIN